MLPPDSPEIYPGAVIKSGQLTSTSTLPTPTFSGSPLPSPGPSSSNAGAIAGGVVGGVVAVAAAVLAIFFWKRKKPLQPRPASFMVDDASQAENRAPISDDSTYVPPSNPASPSSMMKFYVRVYMSSLGVYFLMLPPFFTYAQDPNDPATFPGFRAVPHSPDIPSVVSYTLANPENSLPQGYHGLPTV
jgi:hypothetical protein